MSQDYCFEPHRTAIPRRATSRPLQEFMEQGLVAGRVFHSGAGRPENPDRTVLDQNFETTHYDPHHGPVTRSGLCRRDFDTALSLYVLNVLPQEERANALRDIAMSVSVGGRALFAVRSSDDVQSNKKETWTVYQDGYAVPNHNRFTFQKGYTPDSLRQELLGAFREVEILKSPKHVVMAVARGPLHKVWSLKRGGSLKGTKYPAGKIIGGKIYFHKSVASAVLPAHFLKIYQNVSDQYDHNCLMYDPTAKTFRLDESPDFDSAAEPVVGRFYVFDESGFVREGSSDAIWHHKWQWVFATYGGFDAYLSECWSRYWYGRLDRPASGSARVWPEQIEKLSAKGLFVQD